MSDPTFERVLRSLKENSARFDDEQRARRQRRFHRGILFGLTFVAGLALGACLVLARALI
jgi:hypothetical protein